MPDLGLDQPLPGELILLADAARLKDDEVAIFTEEVGRLEQSIPLGLAVNNLLTYLHTRLKLPLHHLQGGVGHVEGGVLLGVGGGDDGHHVEPVRHIVARVPDGEAEAEVLGLLEEDGLRPLTLEEHEEELLQEGGGRGVRVELSHPGHGGEYFAVKWND